MKLYKDIDYPENPKEVDQSIVDILTSEERSSLRQGYYDEDFERQETNSFGINYGTYKGDRSPVLRGFESKGILYEIDTENNQIIIQPTSGQLSYDEDKIHIKNQFVFEGTLDEVLQEFTNRGYHVVKKFSGDGVRK